MNPTLAIEQLLTIIVFRVAGTDGKAWEVIVDDSWHRTGSGDQTFNTGLFGVGSHTAVLYIAGFQVATASYVEQDVTYPPEPPTPPPPPPPPPPTPGRGEENLGQIGTSCYLYGQGTNGNFYYQVRHYDGSNITSWHRDMEDVIGIGNRSARCHEIPPPPPPTNEELGSRVGILESSIGGMRSVLGDLQAQIESVITAAEQEATAWRSGLDAAISNIRASVDMALFEVQKGLDTRINTMGDFVGQISDIVIPDIWKNINEIYAAAEEESAAWRKGILDLDASLKAWIETAILDIIWNALTREKKGV